MNYDDWNKAIENFFFNQKTADTPVYLQIDSDTLNQIQEGLENGEDDFIEAVRTKLGLSPEDDPLKSIRQLTDKMWTLKNFDQPPPFLGLLAFCVLAASKMYSDKELGFSSGNYYHHLEDLLNGRWKNFRTKLEESDYFWEKLNEWLKLKNYGIPTANSWKGREHVGYPISQILLRRVDREKLPSFFRFCGWQPKDSNIPVEEVKQQLKQWIKKTTCKLTKTCQQIINNNGLDDRVAEMVLAEYQKWDGSDVDQEGNSGVEIRLQISLTSQRFTCQLCLPAPSKFPEGVYILDNEKSFTLKHDPEVENWFEPLDDPTQLLDQFFKDKTVFIHQGKYQLRLTPRKIIPFQEDEEVGDWVSCNRTSLNSLHLILCHQDYQEQVKQFLEQYTDSKWQCLKSSQPVFAKWVCFRGVKIVKTPKNDFDSENLDVLIPRHRVGITFKDGLAIRRGVWLKGAEPQLLITSDPNNIPKNIFIGGIEIPVMESGIVELKDLQLPAGKYKAKIESQEINFEISDLGNEFPTNNLQFGHALLRIKEQVQLRSICLRTIPNPNQLESGELFIYGARLIGSRENTQFPIEYQIILPYGGQRYLVLGKYPGEIAKYNYPTVSVWKAEQNGLVHGYRELVPFEPQWIIKIQNGNEYLIPVGKPPNLPDSSGATGEEVELWCKWVHKKNLARKLTQELRQIWYEYNQIAGAKNG